MIRIRTSTLEQFRKVCQTDFQPESELAERIVKGQWSDDRDVPWYMHAGTAWHRALALELPDNCLPDHTQVRYGDYWFTPEDINEGIATFGPGLREVTGWRTWDVGGLKVQVEGAADHLYGLVVQDAKAKFSDVDPSDYEQSLQWRMYCLIHHARVFRYVLFNFKDPDKAGFLRLKDTYWFSTWAYPDMEADVLVWLHRFMDWARTRGLIHYLINDRRATA